MNLSNEKNTLLNSVSRLAVDLGARTTAKFVTRGAMAAAVLTVAAYSMVNSNPAIASCAPATATADGDGVICNDTVAGGFDSDGYDNIDLDVRPDSSADFIILAPGKEADSSNGNTVIIFDTDPAGFAGTNVGKVNNVAGDGIYVEGDSNLIRNGTGTALGGGQIKGSDDGVDVQGKNNEVTNINNGHGTGSGQIIGGGADGSDDDGIEVSGGTAGNVNTINNGVVGTGKAYIISGGTAGGTVVGDDGIDASGWVNVNNGVNGNIIGEDRGIEFNGASGDTLTVDNDGLIQGDIEDGIVVKGDGSIVNYKGSGTVQGGQESGTAAGIDVSPTVDNAQINVTFEGTTGVIKGTSHGIEVGDTGFSGNNNKIVIDGTGTVEGNGQADADGIHVFDNGSHGTDITIKGGATIQGKDDGIYLGDQSKLVVDGSIVKGDTDGTGGGDGIQGDNGNNILITKGSKVYGDPGVLLDDDNVVAVDGGSTVYATNDGINVDDDNTIIIGTGSNIPGPGVNGLGTTTTSGAGTVDVTGSGDGISLTDGANGPSNVHNNLVYIGTDGLVKTASGDGIVVGNAGYENSGNSIVVNGTVDAGGDGIVVNGQDEDADNNHVQINSTGVVEANGDGVRLLGDSQVTTGLGAISGGGGFFGNGDGDDNDLTNNGTIRAGDDGVVVTNTLSDVDNSGGKIYAGSDGVRFTGIHTDAADGDTPFPGETESGYQSDSDSLIVAGRDGIHYDNYADDGFDSDYNAGGQDVNGLGTLDNPLDLLLGITGTYPEVVDNNGTIEAGRHGISVNDDFAVTNGEGAVIVAGGLPGEGATQGDGIHADANNEIANYGLIATGADADGDSHGIEVTGESNTIVNEGVIDTRGDGTRGDNVIDKINNTTREEGTDGLQDNGAGGDGIHADVDGLTLGGVAFNKYDQQTIYNGGTIIAADDGIDVKSGLGLAGGEQIIDNDDEASITADDDGIVAENFNIITNDGEIHADDDNEGGGDGINVGSSNKVFNTATGVITAGDTGSGIVMDGGVGVFATGNEVTNDGSIDAGVDGIRAEGALNQIKNTGTITGGEDGVELIGLLNTFKSTAGTITGGDGAGIDGHSNNFITLKNTTVTTTVGQGGDGIQLDSDNAVSVSEGSTVTGDDDGLEITGDDNEYKQDGGSVTGRDGDGVYISGGNNTVTMTGGVAVSGEDDGLEINGNDNNTINITGSVSGEDDGLVLVDSSSNTVTITGNVTGDTDGEGGGDGIEINGGEGNIIKVTGAVVGDPGVLLIDTEDNNIKAGSISGNEGGVVIQNGTNNTVKTTTGDIVGDADNDGFGNGVDIDEDSDENTVVSFNNITGEDGVVIGGDDNNVSAGNNITGKNDGVIIDGNSNEVSADNNVSGGDDGAIITGNDNSLEVGNNLTGTDGRGLDVSGDDNNITVDGDINGATVGVSLSGDDNDVDVGGDIKATDGNGVDISGDDNSVNVENEISAEGDGVVLSGDDNKVSADAIDVDGNGIVITGDDNDVEIGSSIDAGLNGVWIQDGSGNSVDLDGVVITAGEDGIQLDNSDNEVEHDEDTVINAGDDGVELNYSGSVGAPEVFKWEGTINADDDGILANQGYMSIINSGTINADFDDNNAGDGIAVGDNSRVENTGDGEITGWNGITGGDKNVVVNSGDIDVENNGIALGDKNDVTNDGTIEAGEDGIVAGNDNKVINNGTITAGDDGIEVDDDNYVENNSNLTIIADDNGIEAGSGNEIINNGTIEADADDDNAGSGILGDDENIIGNFGTISGWNGIEVDDANQVFNGEDAVINAENVGILVNDNNNVTYIGDGAAIENAGEINADIGIKANEGNNIDNNGDINAVKLGVGLAKNNTFDNSGTIDASVGIGVAAGFNNDIFNSNTITGNTDGVLLASGSNELTNTGAIKGTTDDGVQIGGIPMVPAFGNIVNNNAGSITGGDDGVEITGSGNVINNEATITGTNGDGVVVLAGTGNYVVNNSVIEGGDDGVEFASGGNTLNNDGAVYGDDDGVVLAGGSNTVNNTGYIEGEDEGILVSGTGNVITNGTSGEDSALIWGVDGDGIDINSVGGDSNTITNYGTITGEWQGIDNDGGTLSVTNIGGSVFGLNSDGIRTAGPTTITNTSEFLGGVLVDQAVIEGDDDGIDADGASLTVDNGAGSLIQGNNGNGIYTDATDSDITNDGTITGSSNGIYASSGVTTLDITNSGLIEGYDPTLGEDAYAGIHTHAWFNKITNSGAIEGDEVGIADGGAGAEGLNTTNIINTGTGTITGTEAGYLYEGGPFLGTDVVQIDNFGKIEVTGTGVLPAPVADDKGTEVDESKLPPDFINGKDASPVAAIDTSAGEDGLNVFIFNWGTIDGANSFGPAADDPLTKDVDESKTLPPVQTSNRFAILGGDGNEWVANFKDGTINGDVALQGGNDIFAMEIGSVLNGNVDLGQTIGNGEILTVTPDDPDTKENEAKIGFAPATGIDVGTDLVVLFGEGYQDVAGNISEAEVLWVNDRLTAQGIYEEYAPFQNLSFETAVPANMPLPAGTWSLNGNVSVDGTNLWTDVEVDTNGDGTADETVSMVTGTVGTIVDNGRLNVGATAPVHFTATGDLVTQDADGDITDDEKGDGITDFTIDVVDGKDVKTDVLYDKTKMDIMSTAKLTSPVVDVWSGGTLGGHGTIVTNPGANGGNGGVNLSGAVQGDRTITVGADADHTVTTNLIGEARGSLIIATPTTGDLVTQDADGKVTDATKGDDIVDFKFVAAEDEEDPPVKVDLLYTQDEAGKLYPTVVLPAGFVEEVGPAAFDFITDSPRYATIAPGDEINRIGTLTVVGNVTMDGRATEFTQFKVARQDDPATKDKNEALDDKGNQIYDMVKNREVVTNWGSQLQVDLRDDGKGDQLLVKKSGVTSAITGEAVDTVGPVDLVTQNADGTVAKNEGDGVNDFDIVDKAKVNRTAADGIPDSVVYSVSTVLDGHASVDGRLDVRLDGKFVDLVNNSEPPTIPDPEGPTGCGDSPDDADSCPQIPNPAYAVPDGIADVDAKGIAANHADFSKKALVWDVVVAEGGVSGKFDEYGFDGGPNDGAVVTRYAVADDPETTDVDESLSEVRVQLLKAFILYMPDRVRLISIPDFGNLEGLTINQQATADYIDGLTRYGIHDDSLQGLLALIGVASDIPAALDALHPEWYNAFNEVGFTIARGAEQQAYIRTIEAQGFSGGQQNRVVMNIGDDSAVGSSASDKRAAFWLAGSWTNSSIDDGSDEGWLEYKYETLTGYAGFDYLINPNFLLGIMGGFGNTDVDAKNGSGNEGDVDSWQVSGYASYFTQQWFVNIGGGIGDMNIESIRHIAFGGPIASIDQIANADYDGDITFFYGKGGYSFDLGDSGWKLSPELALSYVKVKQDAFSEFADVSVNPLGTNAPNVSGADLLLNVGQQSVESLRGTAQLRLSKTFLSGNGGGWMPYVRVGVANEFEDDLRPITSGFQGTNAAGSTFTVFGKVPRETTVIFGAGVTGKVSEMFSVYLDYSGEIGGSFSEHSISGGVRIHF